jgi:hypothetical protein
MMRALVAVLFFLGQSFWEAKPPEKWSEAEIDTVRRASPWAQTIGPSPEVLVWLATAEPIREAEAEARLRFKHTEKEPDPDYAGYVTEHGDEIFVLAVAYPRLSGLGVAEEQKRMEDECSMVVDHRTYHIVGHFPPTQSDPVLRLVFPRRVKESDKAVDFVLYLAGLPFPERQVEFRVKDLRFHGKLSM